MPRFSVVISVFNKEKYISNTLHSVLNQIFEDFEIVILNDGSTDNSESEILAFKDTRIRYYSEKNQGAGAGRNFVIKKAKGDYIALLDADDIWYPFYLEEQNRLIEKYPSEKIFATNSEFNKLGKINKKEYSILINNKTDLITNFFEASYISSILNSSSTVIKKDALEKIGKYNPNIKSGQDTDFFIRIGLIYSIVFSTRVCTQIIVLKNSLSRSTKSISEKGNFNNYETLEKSNLPLKKYLDLNRFSLALQAKIWGDQVNFNKFISEIDFNNLNKKQRFLLKRNKSTLILLKKLQVFLKNWFKVSAFS